MHNTTSSSVSVRRRFAAAAVVTLAAPLGVLLWTANEAGASDNPDNTATAEFSVDGSSPDDGALTPQDIAELNAEQDALATYLKDHGIAHTVETDGDGIRWVDWNYDDDKANDAVDAFYAARYPLTPDEIKEMNADADGLAAYLKAHGIAYTVETDAYGAREVVWDEDDQKANDAVDAYYASQYPEDAGDGVLIDATLAR